MGHLKLKLQSPKKISGKIKVQEYLEYSGFKEYLGNSGFKEYLGNSGSVSFAIILLP